MTHATRFVAVVAVLTALVLCVPVQAQTPEEIDALRVRAEAGDAGAQNDLGIRYDIGRGVPQDDAEAVRWYRLAADQGDAIAQYNLGFMYQNGGLGVPQDDAEAARWYRLAADQCDYIARSVFNQGFYFRPRSTQGATDLALVVLVQPHVAIPTVPLDRQPVLLS